MLCDARGVILIVMMRASAGVCRQSARDAGDASQPRVPPLPSCCPGCRQLPQLRQVGGAGVAGEGLLAACVLPWMLATS